MNTRVAGLSDVGRCRQTNQDQYLVDAELSLFAIADGMGGHAAGEVASDLAINALADALRESDAGGPAATPAEAAARLRDALNKGNRKICDSMISRAEWRGMGTTMVVLLRVGRTAVVGHVGDSRAYLLRDGELRQLTSDHSWVNEQVKLGLLTHEQAQRHPMRNIVTRALGNQSQVEVDVVEEEIRPGDIFTLCSDGLNGMLSDEEIRDILVAHPSTPREACQALVERANANGGEDNVTVVVVRNDP
jgi:serine/threonine protein phosphatase PrpC